MSLKILEEKAKDQIELLLRMAHKCDARGDVQSPDGRWTYYQGKIDAYEHVLLLLGE